MATTRLALDLEDPITRNSEGPARRGIYAAIKEISDPQGQFFPIWNKIFLTSCVFAIFLDPLFFYILIIDQDNKCLQMDTALRTAALLSRSLTDIVCLVQFICEICGGSSGLESETRAFANEIAQITGYLSPSIIINFFALLPIPQLLIVVAIYKMRGSGYFEHEKVLNFFLLGQYIPRICRIPLSSKELRKTNGIWLIGLFYFLLYIFASHILGALWYFFSIQREMSCWHWACVNYSTDPSGCMDTFNCNSRIVSRNVTFINEHCPTDTPDSASAPFNFGIFLDAIKNNNTAHVKFSTKFFYSFWWGLRNISNFGTNLTTSTYVWENVFAILISITSFLLILYFVGTAQNNMGVQDTIIRRSEIKRKKIRMEKLAIRRRLASLKNQRATTLTSMSSIPPLATEVDSNGESLSTTTPVNHTIPNDQLYTGSKNSGEILV